MRAVFERLARSTSVATPALVLAALVLITLTPIRVPYIVAAAPLLPLMAVYHYSLWRPADLPGVLLLLLGLLYDLLVGGAGSPIGVSALQFLLVRAAADANRRHLLSLSFPFLWLGWALLSAVAVAFAWGAFCTLNWRWVDPQPAMLQYALSLFFYPIVAWALGRGAGDGAARPSAGERS
jgi:rod shape-determining protein MreD